MTPLRLLQLVSVAAVLASAACSSNPASGGGPLPVSQASGSSGERRFVRSNERPNAAGGYLYAENNNSTIAAYAIASSGALTAISGSPYASNTLGPAFFEIAVDPKGPYLYTTGTQSENVAVFSIGSNGGLKPASSKANAGTGASFPFFSPNDKRLYVTDYVNGGAIAAFNVKPKSGALKAIAGSPFGVGCPGFCTSNPTALVMHGSYLYSVDNYGWYVSSFSVAADGALTELNSYATHSGPNEAVMTPNGGDLYVTNGASADISAYGVANGVLTQLSGSPFSAGGAPLGLTMTPNGKFVYVANSGDGTVSGYSIGSGGALHPLSGSPFADGSGTSPTALAVDHGGKHLFVTNGGSTTISVYAIAKSGGIAQIAGSPFPDNGGSDPKGVALYQP